MKLYPGSLVAVVETPGKAAPVNKPPGSIVGMPSWMNLPNSVNLFEKVWSTRINCWLALNTLRKLTFALFEVGLGVGAGIRFQISLMYAAATGSIVPMWFPVAVQWPVESNAVQTRPLKFPASIAGVATKAVVVP